MCRLDRGLRGLTRKGQPLTAVGKVQRIDSLRGFFCDLIDWEWIALRFDEPPP
ncbi:hypothetical protein [Actinocrispum wychmicini]|uniref:hypothetical protein n=1 Tax=Actinocrispum wychmicini TaxID=1213861 RepID=UPI001404A5A5|nr:hypothetical protein [Actinocrispum wychmicini]